MIEDFAVPASSPLRLLLGFSPGSASHNVAQAIVPRLAAHLGRPVELELYPGDSGRIAARLAAASPPDGNTLLVATLGTHALVPAIDPGCGYHPLKDFTPISLLLKAPLILGVPSSSGISSAAELIEAARTADPPLTYGSSAIGGAPHLAAALFADCAGVKFDHVRYRDTRQLYADLVDSRIALSFNNVMSMVPLIRAGKLRALGTTGPWPHPTLRGVPPIADAGLSGYEVSNWLGVVGPAGLPAAVVAQIGKGFAAAARDTAAADVGSDIAACSAEEFAALVRSEWERWKPIVRRLGWTDL
ncbi:MAG TPA: tripartite tricarboxylate transporter substrate-binding protein [Pseudolabrys sp.]